MEDSGSLRVSRGTVREQDRARQLGQRSGEGARQCKTFEAEKWGRSKTEQSRSQPRTPASTRPRAPMYMHFGTLVALFPAQRRRHGDARCTCPGPPPYQCVLSVYFQGHRAEPLTGLLQRAPKGRPTRTPPPVVPHSESIAAQAAYQLR